MTHPRWRDTVVLALWAAVLLAGLYVYLFHRELLRHVLGAPAESPPMWTYFVYLLLGCIRGFTLVPVTYLMVAGMLVLPPVPLFGLTLAGIVVSSAAVYYFAETMRLDRFFETRFAPQVARLRALMARRELPIVIVWSFFPLAPTDLVCYVCGALKVDLKKCLLGVAVGEGTICAIYIALGGEALRWLR
jgi:uncharacterized membrane protein YdjX (TVP38/TMEM64 family)